MVPDSVCTPYLLATKESGSFPDRGKRIFFKASRPALQPTQSRIRWVPAVLFPELKRPGREPATHFHLAPRLKWVQLYLSFAIHAFMVCAGTTYIPTAGSFSFWVTVVTLLRRHRKYSVVNSCRCQALADCWRSRCGLPSRSWQPVWQVSRQVHSLWTDLLCQHFQFGVKLTATQFCKLAYNSLANLRFSYPYHFF